MSEQDLIKKIFIENWTSVYNTILGKEVNISIGSVEKLGKSEVNDRLGMFNSFFSVGYGDAAVDVLVIGLRNRLLSMISNLMIGLDTFKDEITEDDKDAFIEAINQMFSSCQVPLKEELEMDLHFRDIAYIESSAAMNRFTGTDIQLWECEFGIPDLAEEKFVILFPPGFGHTGEETGPRDEVTLHTDQPKAPADSGYNDTTQYDGSNIDLLLDVEIPITVQIGTTEMKLIDIMKLGLGSIVELEKMVDHPVEVYANDKLVARGEVVICDGNYAVRISHVESRAERIKSLA